MKSSANARGISIMTLIHIRQESFHKRFVMKFQKFLT